MNKQQVKYLFSYLKDHVSHFGFYPYDYETVNGKIIEYPFYLDCLSDNQRDILTNIFNKHEEWAK